MKKEDAEEECFFEYFDFDVDRQDPHQTVSYAGNLIYGRRAENMAAYIDKSAYNPWTLGVQYFFFAGGIILHRKFSSHKPQPDLYI